MECTKCNKELIGNNFGVKINKEVFICKRCIKELHNITEETFDIRIKEKGQTIEMKKILKPVEIFELLSENIIGQDKAKRTLAVNIYNHVKRSKFKKKMKKSNILIVGPSGSGKTEMLVNLSQILDIPMVMQDATSLTQAGYVGEDVQQMLLQLILKADYDIGKAQKGIIYIDEIDKLAKKGDAGGRDVSGEGVQHSLLKMIEGQKITLDISGIDRRNDRKTNYIEFDTSDVLFICGGAFDSLTGNKTNIITSKELIDYGMSREFVGRVPVVCQTKQLNSEDLKKILTVPKNSILNYYKKLLETEDVELELDEDAISAIAERAISENLGARGLRPIMEEIMEDLLYEVPSYDDIKKVKIFIKDGTIGREMMR